MFQSGFLSSIFLHISTTPTSAIDGFLHPLFGLDHLLAMLTVGLLSAQLGGRSIWTVPSAFVTVMALGGILGILGMPLPIVEYGIALSVVVLGLALLAKRRIPEAVAMIFVGVFALFHGHAHGAELPEIATDVPNIIAYVIGFLTATIGLHVIGALIGYIALRSSRGALVLRLSGAIVAALGLFLVFSI
jgi:urease accessory protein